ncbi:hypothetical protein JCM21900_001938 [Sporobolomyces salmonicolor]
MCGIVFTVSSAATSAATRPASLSSDDLSSPPHPAPGADSDGPGFGLPRRDGTRASSFLSVDEMWERLVDGVKERGPDASDSRVQHVQHNQSFSYELRFHASILHMRGEGVSTQPFVADNGDVLLWNGEIFDGLDVAPNENDGRKLFDLIESSGPSNFFAAIRNIEGPYAFVFYQASTSRIYFGRDPLGRRSLLLHPPTPVSPFFVLVSSAPGRDFPLKEWEEVGCEAVHCYHLLDAKGEPCKVDGKRGLSACPRYPKSMGCSQNSLIYPFDRLVTTLPQPGQLTPMTRSIPPQPVMTSHLSLALQSFLAALETSVRQRVLTVPSIPPAPAARIAILFSGGLDCTALAVILDRVLPEREAVDLINVAFENPRKLKAKEDGPQKGRKGNKKGKSKGRVIDGEVESMEIEDDEVGRGVAAQAAAEAGEPVDPSPPAHSSTPAPDSTSPSPITAPQDLSIYDVPDRLTGRASWHELRRLRPNRRWNLVEVNVPYEEMLEHRQKVVELMRPQNTVMDLSIAIAFYFAARGKGVLASDSSSFTAARELYHSRARVLLSGLGADELLGGYARHRRAFQQPLAPPPLSATSSPLPRSRSPSFSEVPPSPPENWPSLVRELQLDLDRLSTRNLGRDDRIVSSHGKEARYPFLAAHVVDFCANLPVWLKCDMRFGEGVGDKMLLRVLARNLGLQGAASLPKRAIHFGARTAKMELNTGRARGTDVLES